MASRSLEDLHPIIRTLAKKFDNACFARGVKILIYMTYRSKEEQDELYAQGRTKPGKIVTNAKGGQSAHNHTINGMPASLAFDAVPLINKECQWNDNWLWKQMGDAAKEVGLKWGGDWKKFVDKPHFYIEEGEAE